MIFNRSKWFYLVGFFLILALPLLNLPPWFSPPDWGKTIVFRIVLSILIFLFICQLSGGRISVNFPREGKIGVYLLLALLGIYFLATIFSLDLNFSLWGSPYRSGGFFNFAFYIIFAILTFLILSDKDWQKLWDFSIFIGILVSIVAIFQWQGLFKEIFIPFETRPPSTVGGPIFLAIYLLLLSFLSLSFGLEKAGLKKFFYFFSFLFFLFVALFIAQTRAAFVGFVIGLFYFIVFHPVRRPSISLGLKIFGFLFLILIFCLIYYVNAQKEIPQLVKENRLLLNVWHRLSIKRALTDPRISGWKVSWQALKEKPILGYGPENFSIGFDKYYDPSLPGIEKMPGDVTSWWDRAHNFVFDIGLTAGIPALIIYLSVFGLLFWQLQKIKFANLSQYGSQSPRIIAQGIQATFLAYLAANFFSFDTFSTYLISFLLVGYSLHLIAGKTEPIQKRGKTFKWQGAIIFLFFVGLVWFIWEFNLRPLSINSQINIAKVLVNQGNCELAFQRLDEMAKKKSIIDAYLRKKYIEFLLDCQAKKPELAFELVKKGEKLAKEVVAIQPYCTRTWINLAAFVLDLLKQEKNPEIAQELKKEVYFALERAHQLSPKRQEVFLAQITADFLTGQYQKAKEKSRECVNLNPKLAECHWLEGLSEIFLGEFEQGKKSLKRAEELGYSVNSQMALEQLAQAYLHQKNYRELVEIFQRLIQIDPSRAQYQTSLALIYRELGKTEEAKKQALKILEQWPEYRKEVEEFLQNLSK